ncbi:DUF72 domain-containing protein [Chryseobacterium sp. HSC-36S06]|uniref:DUF72 domain-containing protein n=1 Tax=Chryseobacterium sp. HSC-36S06 TaxID=2910970 RepID=UPI00209EAA9F|nr:DUF72 domain-containing protein [Chryseobacterium sp. HSC-36S06]MCP2038405.1 uncharacterized protein YecE (DUF72 family) [Chryseobacterium sp. HSC-36S06]
MKHKTYIGCSGFSNRDWKGFFFPEELPSKEQLNFYSTQFNTVEINSTFYRRPRPQTLENWYQRTDEDFKFFIKIPKTITHIKRLKETAAETADFCQHIHHGIQEKLAGFLFQMPPSFHYREENLEQLITTVDSQFLNVVEFRHESWWTEEIFETLRKKNIVVSGVSFPKNIPDDFIINNSKSVYYRLHGVPVLFKSEYSEEELKKLAKDIKKAKQDVFVFFNNTWGTAALKNAFYLKELLE